MDRFLTWLYKPVVPVHAMTDRSKLYGLPGAEEMYFDPAEVVQRWLDDRYDDAPLDFVIEEWSVHPTQHHLPSARALLEWIEEWAIDCGEVGEGWELPPDDSLDVAADALLEVIAHKITWRMANEKLRELHVTASDDPANPLLDGEPVWRDTSTPRRAG